MPCVAQWWMLQRSVEDGPMMSAALVWWIGGGLVYGCMGWVGGAYVVVEGFGFAVGKLYQFCLLV